VKVAVALQEVRSGFLRASTPPLLGRDHQGTPTGALDGARYPQAGAPLVARWVPDWPARWGRFRPAVKSSGRERGGSRLDPAGARVR